MSLETCVCLTFIPLVCNSRISKQDSSLSKAWYNMQLCMWYLDLFSKYNLCGLLDSWAKYFPSKFKGENGKASMPKNNAWGLILPEVWTSALLRKTTSALVQLLVFILKVSSEYSTSPRHYLGHYHVPGNQIFFKHSLRFCFFRSLKKNFFRNIPNIKCSLTCSLFLSLLNYLLTYQDRWLACGHGNCSCLLLRTTRDKSLVVLLLTYRFAEQWETTWHAARVLSMALDFSFLSWPENVACFTKFCPFGYNS